MKHSLSTAQFKVAFTESKSLRVGDLLFKYKKDVNPKLGLIVSRKYGNAVYRNLFKRRCRAQFQTLINNGFTNTLIISPKKKNISWTEISTSFDKLAQQLSD
ncbi:MAG: ribonuclease P protein component [Candidatus Marinimicrobia bacterium]|nr:ribonuclease P protein component [Candidatus Neomarinimicrobiota bacterium]